MDLVTIGIILATIIIGAICAVLFKAATRETTFEEAYGQTARRLLVEEKPKPKPKAAKVKKAPKSVEKEKTDEVVSNEKQQPVPSSVVTSNSESLPSEGEASNKNADDNALKKNKKKNRPKKQASKSAEDSSEKVESPVVKVNAAPAKVEPTVVKTEQPKPQPKLETKAEPQVVKQSVPLQQTEAPKQKAKRSVPANISVTDVIDRLKSLTDLEPEYVTFLVRYKDTCNNKESQLHETINSLKKENADKERLSKQANNNLTSISNENLKLKNELKAHKDQYEVFETSVRSKLAETIQLKEENKRLSAALSQSAQRDAHYQQLVREVEVLRGELSKKTVLNDDVETSKKLIEKLKSENAEVTKLYRETVSSKTAIENELSDLKKVREALKVKEQEALISEKNIYDLSKELERVTQAGANLEKSHNYHVEQAENYKTQAEKLLNERNTLFNEINVWKSKLQVAEDRLNQDTSNKEHYEAQLNKLIAEKNELLALNAKLGAEEARAATLESENKNLVSKLDIANLKLNDFINYQKQYEADKASLKAAAARIKELESQIEQGKTSSLQSNSNSVIQENGDSSTGLNSKNVVITTNGKKAKVNGTQTSASTKPKDTSHLHVITWPISDWSKAPNTVLLCSNWWKWSDHQAMKRTESGFEYSLNLKDHGDDHVDEFLFKFIVDGTWQCSKQYSSKIDTNGIENNCLNSSS